MPTVTEVEDRLRRAAAACEPLVDDLLAADDLPTPVPLRTRPPRGRRAAPWLLAAAAVVALGLAAALVVADDDGTTVRTSPPSPPATNPAPTTGDDPTTSAAPTTSGPTTAPSGALVDTLVPLPDGTEVVLAIPGPDRWTPNGATALLVVPGVDEPVPVALFAAPVEDLLREGATAQDQGDGVSLVEGPDAWRWLAVERDGWTAIVTLVAEGDVQVPAAVEGALAADLDFVVVDGRPVDVVGPEGTEVPVVERILTASGDPQGLRSSLVVSSSWDIAADPCPAPEGGAPVRCFDEYGLAVSAVGPLGTPLLDRIELRPG